MLTFFKKTRIMKTTKMLPNQAKIEQPETVLSSTSFK